MFGKKVKSSKIQIQQQKNKKKQNHHEKIKNKCFQIFISQGIDEYCKTQENKINYATINNLSEFSQELMKNFSSLYLLDHKSFQWKQKIDALIKSCRQILKMIQKLKKQVKDLNEIKKNQVQIDNQNEKIRLEYMKAKQRCQQLQQQHKLHKQLQQIHKEQAYELYKNQLRLTKQQLEQTKKQISGLKNENQKFKIQKQKVQKQLQGILEKYKKTDRQLTSFKDRFFKDQSIMINHFNNEAKQQIQLKPRQIIYNENQENKTSNLFQDLVLKNSQLSSILIQFLPPKSIFNILSLNKTIRFYLYKSVRAMNSTFKSIVNFKNYQINYFHRHINHFQNLSKKIPQEILQLTFYQYNILKQTIGGDFISILNLCSHIFQGKFQMVNQNKTVKQYVQSKQIIHFVQLPKQEELFLRIQKQMVNQFFQQRKIKKQIMMKEIQSMSLKILTTQSLYSYDQKTLKEFYQTVIKNFTILFVLSKYLFEDSRNIQHLNSFLLSQLNQIDKFRIQKQFDMEDVRTQLQSYKKMKQFFSERSNKSQERLLRSNKQINEQQKQITKLNNTIKQQESSKQTIIQKVKQKETQISRIQQKYKQLKEAYNISRQKYNGLLNELRTVREEIIGKIK